MRRLLHTEGVERAEDVAALALPCVIFSATAPAKRSIATHLGGLPDLAPATPWPRSASGTPLIFLGQIDLTMLVDQRFSMAAGALPAAGLLGWFYDSEGSPPAFAMTFTTGPARRPRDPPPEARVLPACEVELVPAWSLPRGGPDCPFLATLGLGDDARDVLRDVLSLWSSDRMPPGHQLLGYAHALDEPYVGAALDSDDALRERWLALEPREHVRPAPDSELFVQARQYRLCAEFHDDPIARMAWGDGAPLSFLLRRDAWAQGAFEQASPSRVAVAWCQRS